MAKKRSKQKVGYRNPPVEYRWGPGQSGNPGGRRRGSRSLGQAVLAAGDEVVDLVVNGERRSLTKREIAAMMIYNDAAKGKLAAFDRINEIENRYRSRGPAMPEAEIIRFTLALDDQDHNSPPSGN